MAWCSPKCFTIRIAAGLWACLLLSAAPALAGARPALSSGQTVYVPGYSHIYSGDRERPVLLAITLSIRNTDPKHGIRVDRVEYFDSAGKLVKIFLDAPSRLGPMASTRYVVPESDKAGGSGANFIVRWSAPEPAAPPIIETIMISTRSQQGISFTSRGQVIEEKNHGKRNAPARGINPAD